MILISRASRHGLISRISLPNYAPAVERRTARLPFRVGRNSVAFSTRRYKMTCSQIESTTNVTNVDLPKN